jgi:hypothetical protein
VNDVYEYDSLIVALKKTSKKTRLVGPLVHPSGLDRLVGQVEGFRFQIDWVYLEFF